MKSSRQIAAEALLKVEDGGYSQLCLDSALKNSGLSQQDISFTSMLFYGVIERKLTLDHCLSKYIKKKPTQKVAIILRCAVFQMLHMDFVPPHAAISEAVELTRKMGQTSAAGMVNAVLRSFQRDNMAVMPFKGDRIDKISIEYSCSKDVAKAFVEWYGEEKTKEILACSFGRPPLFLRVNTLKISGDELYEKLTADGYKVFKRHLDGDCFEVEGGVIKSCLHSEGYYHIQDICSQNAALLLEAKKEERILDICAAPGSKSFILAQQMNNTGEILSCDIASKRLALVRLSAEKLGILNIKTVENDASAFNAGLGKFDRILCDLPCSGLGVIRRKPEIKYRTADSWSELPSLQLKILEAAVNYLKPCGVMVFSTCTINPNENDMVIEKLLKNHPELKPYPFDGGVWKKTNLPDREGGDGFFVARIRKNNDA